jgi:hypothetical protein
MRIALCLHGLCGGKNSKGRIIRAVDGYKCIKRHLLDKYPIDVFMHSWTVSEKDNITKLYSNDNPDRVKATIFEKSDSKHSELLAEAAKYKFNKQYYTNMCNLYYSYQSVNGLKTQYEIDNKFTYDFVIHTRFDLNIINIAMDLTTCDPTKVYFIGLNGPLKKILDHFWISGSSTMNKFIEMYPHITDYNQKLANMHSNNQYLNHDLITIHAKETDQLKDLVDMKGNFKGGTFPMKDQHKL